MFKLIDDERIKLYINERNISCSGNLEECKKEAIGDSYFHSIS